MIVRLLGKSWLPTLSLTALAFALASQSRAQSPAGRYDVAAGLVTDTHTGLVWQQTDSGGSYTFAAAQQHCADLGASFRAPSVKELLTLVDESRANPAVDSAVFSTIPNGGNLVSCYQTSTPLAGTNLAWLVCFDAGRPTYDSVNDAYRVLCVR
jgi:hypothetical protein